MAVQYTVQTPSVVGDDRFRSTTWTYDEQDEYKALLKGAFTSKAIQQVLERNLYFHTEVEAFAHYLMHNAQKYRAIFSKTADTTVLGLDFGGFSMKHRSTDITTSGTDRLKIICDPFHGRGNKAGLLLAHDRCYDVVELPIPKKGTWRFTVDSVRQGHDGERMFLQLSRRRLGEVSTEVPVLHLELYFDRTANCYLIYDGNGKIDDAHRGLALTDDDQLVACSSATTSPQVEEAAPVPEGTPQAKRMMKRTWQMAPMARLPFTSTKRAKPVATSSAAPDSYSETGGDGRPKGYSYAV
ncbi:hypothetical protein K4K52_001763 [Colletotrichum sp. SAR 10_76]|nr:hypothetical protein K4K52_001763 [Colletotrichum sp. SAR 10_76]